MKFAEFIEVIGDWVNRDDLDRVAPKLIQFGQRLLEKELRLETMQAREARAITIGDESFAVPVGYIEMISARLIEDADTKRTFDPLNKVGWKQFSRSGLPEIIPGRPTSYSRANVVGDPADPGPGDTIPDPDTGFTALPGDSFIFDCPAKVAYVLEYGFYRKEAVMSADSDTNWWLDNAEDALLYATLVESVGYLGDDPRQRTWEKMLALKLDELKNDDRRSRRGGHHTNQVQPEQW